MAWKAKARWILLGHRDPDAQELERYAPTPATPTVYLAFQIISSLGYGLVIMDVHQAHSGNPMFMSASRGLPLLATMPPSGIPGHEKHWLIRVLTAVYGLVNAPAIWRKTVRRALCELGYVGPPSTLVSTCCLTRPLRIQRDFVGAPVSCYLA